MKYKVTDQTEGIEWETADGAKRRVESGQIADDIPAESVGWMIEQGLIEPVEDATGSQGEINDTPIVDSEE